MSKVYIERAGMLTKEERKKLINFGEFMKTNISGKFLINMSWLEYLLNLFAQGYLAEFWEEIQDTKINHCESIENTSYGLLNLLDLKMLSLQTPCRHNADKQSGDEVIEDENK